MSEERNKRFRNVFLSFNPRHMLRAIFGEHFMSRLNPSDRLFGAKIRNAAAGACATANQASIAFPPSRCDFERTDHASALARLVKHYGDPGRFQRMPIVIQSAVCDCAVALMKLAGNKRELQGQQFVKRHGLPHHREFLAADSAPAGYRHWYDFSCFVRNQRTWQIRVFRASLSLRNASAVASGTDQLAEFVARQIEREVTGATFFGQIYTAPRGRHGRPPAIEASVAYGGASRVLVAMDGKDPVTERDVLKIASDCSAAARLHTEFRWVQPVLILPAGCDVRSVAVLKSALVHRVFMATTALPTRPLGLLHRAGT